MATGNVCSYARVLNGPQQVEKIKTFNELAATMATLRKERDQAKAESSARRKEEEQRKAARKAEKEREASMKQNELGPVCKAHVDKGLEHVLTLKVPERRDVLRYHFQMASVEIEGVSKPVYKLTLAETAIALQRLVLPMPQLPAAEAIVESNEMNIDGDDDVVMNDIGINDGVSNGGGNNDVVA